MIIILLILLVKSPDSLWQVEYQHILEGLELMNFAVSDLEFDKQWVLDSFRLEVISDLMNHPLKVPEYVIKSGREINKCSKAGDYLNFTCQGITQRQIKPDKFKSKDLEGIIRETFALTKDHLDNAFKNLSVAERDSLIYTAPSLWADEADSLVRGYAGALHKEFGMEHDTVDTLKLVSLLRLAQKIDLAELHRAGATLTQGVEQIIPLVIKEFIEKKSPPCIRADGVEGVIYRIFKLNDGRYCVIGGPGTNIYTGDFAVIIDPGGNDIYEGRTAGAVGELGTPVSFVLDLSGDDVYRNYKKLVNQGAALFGVALLWDLGGNDSYNAFHIAQGAGLFGIGMLVDENGEDSYRSGYFTQGAGNFGSGIFIDHKGDDIYHAFSWTQGLGGPWGYGLLTDNEGDDVYYAGGMYLHMPLDPDQYRSFSQGFGFGWRDVASGGIGFLYDKQGNDKYVSEVYGQATSYWYALGMLLDEQGNDLYSAAQYSQGSGIHLSVGSLVDLEGDDHYFSRFGPAQGEGHDLAVGWLLDKDGDDVYYASGGQGIGLTNAVGIFVDTRGNDDYCSREALSQAGANWSRGTGGIGLFVDLQGDDHYAEKDKGTNNHVWTSGTYALGMDLEAVEPKKEEWEDTITVFPEIDTMQTDSAKMVRLFHYASLWEVRTDIPKVRTARKMLKEQYGAKAVGYIFNHEFVTFDGLVLRAIENHFKEFKDTAAYYLYQGLKSTNDTIVRNSIYLLGKLEIKNSRDTLRQFLEKEPEDKFAGPLITALGEMKDTLSIPIITKYAKHKKERMKLRVAVALQDIKDTLGIPILVKQLTDPCYVVKAAAIEGIANIGKKGLDAIEDEMKKTKKDDHIATLIKTLRKTYVQLDASSKTSELKKHLAELVQAYLHSDYPALCKEAQLFIDEIEGKSVLTPSELFLYPDQNED